MTSMRETRCDHGIKPQDYCRICDKERPVKVSYVKYVKKQAYYTGLALLSVLALLR